MAAKEMDYARMAALAALGDEVCKLVHDLGLMVPRGRPGRRPKPEAPTRPGLIRPKPEQGRRPNETEEEE